MKAELELNEVSRIDEERIRNKLGQWADQLRIKYPELFPSYIEVNQYLKTMVNRSV